LGYGGDGGKGGGGDIYQLDFGDNFTPPPPHLTSPSPQEGDDGGDSSKIFIIKLETD